MQNFILLILVLILLESSFLVYRNIKNNKSNSRGSRRRIFIDTSVLIDGRILAIAETGFLSDEMYIPRSVLRELQLLADNSIWPVSSPATIVSFTSLALAVAIAKQFLMLKQQSI